MSSSSVLLLFLLRHRGSFRESLHFPRMSSCCASFSATAVFAVASNVLSPSVACAISRIVVGVIAGVVIVIVIVTINVIVIAIVIVF